MGIPHIEMALTVLLLLAGCLLVNGCCITCQKYATGPRGCEWGDKNGDEWCSNYFYVTCDEPSYKEGCCKTCSEPKTTPLPQPIPTFKPQPTYNPDNNHGSAVKCGLTPI